MTIGSAHLCFVVRDLPTFHRQLALKGVRFRSEPVTIDAGVNKGGRSVYLLDPDGIYR